MEKKPELFKFFLLFPYFSRDFVDWNVEKDPQGKNVLSSMLSEELHAVFQLKIVWNQHRKRQIFSNKLPDFHHNSSIFFICR